MTARRPHTGGPRADRMIAALLRIDQVWAARRQPDQPGERWIVHQIHRADRLVTLRHATMGRRTTLTFRELRGNYSLVLLAGTGVRVR